MVSTLVAFFCLITFSCQSESEQKIKGFSHGSVPELNLFLLALVDPHKDQFTQKFIVLIPANQKVRSELEQTERFQKMTIKKGKFINKETPQPHLLVYQIELGQKWKAGVKFIYSEQTNTHQLEELYHQSEITCLVHAVLYEGRVLVINYQGIKIPVNVTNPELTKNLWSHDLIKIRYTIRSFPKKPPHLELISVELVDLMSARNEKDIVVEGALVWFPKTPVTSIEIWGVEEELGDGSKRYYALFNFDDEKDYQKTARILKDVWYQTTNGFVGRKSSFYNTNIKIQAKGKLIQNSPNQGNPIISVESKNVKILSP